jgi:DNA-binding NarL/FixJ family response regulator
LICEDHREVRERLAAVLTTLGGGSAARPHMVATVAHASTAPTTMRTGPSTPSQDSSPLSEREHQVPLGMSEGKSNGEIGRELFLAQDTINTHARRMFRKLQVGDRAEAVAHGFRHSLLI